MKKSKILKIITLPAISVLAIAGMSIGLVSCGKSSSPTIVADNFVDLEYDDTTEKLKISSYKTIAIQLSVNFTALLNKFKAMSTTEPNELFNYQQVAINSSVKETSLPVPAFVKLHFFEKLSGNINQYEKLFIQNSDFGRKMEIIDSALLGAEYSLQNSTLPENVVLGKAKLINSTYYQDTPDETSKKRVVYLAIEPKLNNVLKEIEAENAKIMVTMNASTKNSIIEALQNFILYLDNLPII